MTIDGQLCRSADSMVGMLGVLRQPYPYCIRALFLVAEPGHPHAGMSMLPACSIGGFPSFRLAVTVGPSSLGKRGVGVSRRNGAARLSSPVFDLPRETRKTVLAVLHFVPALRVRPVAYAAAFRCLWKAAVAARTNRKEERP